ncbi:nucleotidyltransferase domain protein [archaeon BMS3Bbin15]|nr:nucleotidyltransferase domain protein [archaeon BMS3Bbin15]
MSPRSIGEIKELLEKYKEELKRKYKIKEIGIFGSYVREEQKETSDIDILVEFGNDAELSLLDFIGIEQELSDLLGVKVDLVEKKTLKPYIGEHIKREVVYL